MYQICQVMTFDIYLEYNTRYNIKHVLAVLILSTQQPTKRQ